MSWRGIVGRSFKTTAEFSAYIDTVKLGVWRPRFVVVHNTSAPDLKTYANWQTRKVPVTDEQWMLNLQGYYRDQQGWSSGPHLFVTPKSICVFSPLTGPGTHSPSWNSISWGVETVGEFETDPFDGTVRYNLAAAVGILHLKAGLQLLPYQVGVSGLHFHKEDVRTTHKSCPGRHINKADLISRAQAWIDNAGTGDHHPVLIEANLPVDEPAPQVALRRGDKGDLVKKLQTLLGKHSIILTIDGDFGPATELGVKRFQQSHQITSDGVCGPRTWALLKKPEQTA